MKALRRTVLVLLTTFSAAGCSSLTPSFLSPDQPAAAKTDAPLPPPPKPAARAESQEHHTAPSPPPMPAPQQLPGLNQDEVSRLLGQPAATEQQAMATVWHYRRGRCRLNLVFYPEVETSVLRVLSYEFERGRPEACLKYLHRTRTLHGK